MYYFGSTSLSMDIYNSGVTLVETDENSAIYEVDCNTSDGAMAVYDLFQGIQVAYFSFHANSCFKREASFQNILEISYCHTGRYECQYNHNHLTYQGEGDIAIGILKAHQELPIFPTSCYEGVALIIALDKVKHEFANVIDGISINFLELSEKYCTDYRCTVMKATNELRHVFEEIFIEKNRHHLGYLRLKILEILFLLSELLPQENIDVSPYYSKATIEKVKALKAELMETLDQKVSLVEWASRYGLSLTTMKECFKSIYGKPIYSFQKEYRMQVAAHLLLTTDLSILDIAGTVGYSNPNKFSTTFRAATGASPSEYRHPKT